MNQRRVVVTGIGTINPLGDNISEYFANLEKGVSAAAPITRFDARNFKTRFACEIKNYDWARYFDRKEVRKYDRYAQYAMIAVAEAMQDSALEVVEDEADRIGVIYLYVRRAKNCGIPLQTETASGSTAAHQSTVGAVSTKNSAEPMRKARR